MYPKIIFIHGKLIRKSSFPLFFKFWSLMNFFVCALACSAFPVWLTSVGLVTSATLVSILPYTVIPVECITSSLLQLLLLNSSKPNRPEVTPSRNKYHLTSKSPPQPLCTSVYGRKEILGLGLTLREGLLPSVQEPDIQSQNGRTQV